LLLIADARGERLVGQRPTALRSSVSGGQSVHGSAATPVTRHIAILPLNLLACFLSGLSLPPLLVAAGVTVSRGLLGPPTGKSSRAASSGSGTHLWPCTLLVVRMTRWLSYVIGRRPSGPPSSCRFRPEGRLKGAIRWAGPGVCWSVADRWVPAGLGPVGWRGSRPARRSGSVFALVGWIDESMMISGMRWVGRIRRRIFLAWGILDSHRPLSCFISGGGVLLRGPWCCPGQPEVLICSASSRRYQRSPPAVFAGCVCAGRFFESGWVIHRQARFKCHRADVHVQSQASQGAAFSISAPCCRPCACALKIKVFFGQAQIGSGSGSASSCYRRAVAQCCQRE